MSRHRVPMLHASLQRHADPETSRDPRLRAVVAGLRDLDYAPEPRQEFRSELRRQLVAVAPRIIAESAPGTEEAAAKVGDVVARPSRQAHFRPGRLVGVTASVVVVLALLLGGAVWVSQNALPGDTLYGLKRASENVHLDLTSGSSRGHEYLSLASTRVNEARALLGTSSAAGGGISSSKASLIRSTLRSADSDLRNGSSELTQQARQTHSPKPLSIMTDWAPTQLTLLKGLLTAVPTKSLQARTKSSWLLVNAALARAEKLQPELACGTSCAKPASSTAPGAPRSHRGGTHAVPGSAASRATTHGVQGHASGHPGSHPSGSTSTSTAGGTHSTPPTKIHAPVLPIPTRAVGTTPVSVGTCGVGVDAGPVHVKLGRCHHS